MFLVADRHELKVLESVKNPKIKALKKLLTKKERDKTKQFLVEGFHLVEEALKAKVAVELILSEKVVIPSDWSVEQVDITKVTPAIMKELCETETPQGIIAVCRQKEEHLLPTFRKVLLIDSIQDPGNLGTIIRTADAAKLDAVVLGKGTVDVYNSKVIRSTQGSIFHVPIVKEDLRDVISELKKMNVPVYGTSLTNGTSYRNIKPSSEFALIVGNEGNGVSEHVLQLTDQNLYIPIYGKAESLNVAVASAILMYHFVK
ncbi:RNA methyltransferase [Bacillus sp. FJAT-47783]|uniref:TrmH family RNA methyltransferase n=1 Tax=Bacillus sp. FJAT-47783 TaxID=2922712 RepID=UPI001FADDD2B|nr:RNA methyltransferase [Bacillus sp. FJAT-47783]